MKRFLIVLFVPLIFVAASGGGCSADSEVSYKQEQMMKEAIAQVDLPAITNWQEKKLMKMILELRDQENLQTYVYIVPEMTGKPVFLGRAIGYGIPYATQYTNPLSSVNGRPQAEPNGLFMPDSAEGTWVMLIDPKGQPRPVYVEPRVIVSPFPLAQ